MAGPAVHAAELPWGWLETPLAGLREQPLAAAVAWHGRLMVLAWGLLIPLGVLVARFFKVMPRQPWPAELDNRCWWHGHRLAQWGGIAAASAGAWLIWGHGAGASGVARVHGWLGWCIVTLGWLQAAGGLLRGSKGGPTDEATHEGVAASRWHGDHYAMTPRRCLFEYVHKLLGYALLAAAAATLLLGLWVVQAPRWMWLLLAAWWLLWGTAFAILQRGGWCIDTYQAIWGPGAMHPGNHRAPIGWGIARHTRLSIRRRSLLRRCQPGRAVPPPRQKTTEDNT